MLKQKREFRCPRAGCKRSYASAEALAKHADSHTADAVLKPSRAEPQPLASFSMQPSDQRARELADVKKKLLRAPASGSGAAAAAAAAVAGKKGKGRPPTMDEMQTWTEVDSVHIDHGDEYLDELCWLSGRSAHYRSKFAFQIKYKGVSTLTFGQLKDGSFRDPTRVLASETFRCRGHNCCEGCDAKQRCRVLIKRKLFASDPLTWRVYRNLLPATAAARAAGGAMNDLEAGEHCPKAFASFKKQPTRHPLTRLQKAVRLACTPGMHRLSSSPLRRASRRLLRTAGLQGSSSLLTAVALCLCSWRSRTASC